MSQIARPDRRPADRPLGVNEWPYATTSESALIDSHCHLDFVFTKNAHTRSFTHFRLAHRDTFPYCYGGCVANFCEPETFEQRRLWRSVLSDNAVWGAFGCHPRRARDYNDDVERHLVRSLNDPSVVALGEIGLDYSISSGNGAEPDREFKKTQEAVFRRQLALARRRCLPLVIHSRDATADTIRVLKEMVPADYPIHRHCFTRDWDEAKCWLDTFPRLCLGITPLVGFPGVEPLVEAAGRIPLDRLLLETDAPFFLPKRESKRLVCSHPGMIIHVATKMSAIRQIPLDDVISAVRENTRRVYGI
ncbi:hypothetical protein HPB50_012700 [Hyalomma asiaticum]|uniref:Uncharacterized protein n=1 Tax=Hyalomma asiaticum TaxID=266040 RepID=A0ACB7T289_HYAAI|nr:hypothetical protein HPB50_012700 [Hyalomma asiaticum]